MSAFSSQKESRTQKLSDNVYAVIGHEGESNTGFLVYEQGLVVIDNDIRTLDRQLEAIRKETQQEIKFLINTHHAFDHCSANQVSAERGATIISSAKCRQCLQDEGEQKFEEMLKQGKSLAEIQQELFFPEYENWGKSKFYPGTIKKIYDALTLSQ